MVWKSTVGNTSELVHFPLLGAWRLGTVSWAIVSREDWLALPNETLFVPKEWNERGDDGDDGWSGACLWEDLAMQKKCFAIRGWQRKLGEMHSVT